MFFDNTGLLHKLRSLRDILQYVQRGLLRLRMFDLRLPLVESSELGIGVSRQSSPGSGCAASGIRISCSLARDADKWRSCRLCDVSE